MLSQTCIPYRSCWLMIAVVQSRLLMLHTQHLLHVMS